MRKAWKREILGLYMFKVWIRGLDLNKLFGNDRFLPSLVSV